jgi:GNAT superfamily N-acetyltransferase
MTPPRSPARHAGQAVVRAGQADIPVLSKVIADAFSDLAPSQWLIENPAARRQIFPGYFGLLIEHAMASGLVCTTPGRDSAALWIPAGADGPQPPGDYAGRLAAVTRPWTSRFLAFDAALEKNHPAGIPHHYLAILAVRPDRQRQGTGTALLRAHHATLDRDGVPAYLEASDPGTRTLYLACGYADHGPPVQLPGGPLMYPMARKPGSG